MSVVLPFAPRGRRVRIRGVAYRIEPPSVQSVLTLLREMPVEVLAAVRAARAGEWSRTPLAEIVRLFVGHPGARSVVETIARAPDGRRVDLSGLCTDELLELALAALRLCDLRRVIDSLGLDEALERATAGGAWTFQAEGFDLLTTAADLGVSPFDLMDLPWEVCLDARASGSEEPRRTLE